MHLSNQLGRYPRPTVPPPTPFILAEAYLHNLSPFIVEFTQGFGLRWYGTAYALGFVVGWFVLRWLSRRGVTPLSEQRITDAMLILCMGVVIGGRLGYVAFYDPSLLTSFTSAPPWWGVLQLNKGGMSSHGGMLGVLTACYLISRGVKQAGGARTGGLPMLHIMDLTALACTPGLFFGRLANFVNGELLGDIVALPGKPSPWWSVKYPQELFTKLAPPLSPEQSVAFKKLLDTYRVGTEGDEYTFDRILHILQSGAKAQSSQIAAQLSPLISARHPSQLYQAATEGLILFVLLLLAWISPRKPGVIVAMFLGGYGVMRILTELIRLPDAHLEIPRILGLSRGQWLSVAMIGFSALCAFLASKQAKTFGGWAIRANAETSRERAEGK